MAIMGTRQKNRSHQAKTRSLIGHEDGDDVGEIMAMINGCDGMTNGRRRVDLIGLTLGVKVDKRHTKQGQ